jgi:hypothetical protein
MHVLIIASDYWAIDLQLAVVLSTPRPVDWGVQSERQHRAPENLGPLISGVHASN